jgi:hypothetical protein
VDIETMRIWDGGGGSRIVILVSFDMFLGNRGWKRLENEESLVCDIEVGLESALETPEGRMGESTADDCFVVNISSDGVGGDLVGSKMKPSQESSIDVETGKMAKTFDSGGGGIGEVVDGVPSDRGATG